MTRGAVAGIDSSQMGLRHMTLKAETPAAVNP
jgi:hypothetical protein